jgi:NADH-quinone oxidoreductase subunit J
MVEQIFFLVLAAVAVAGALSVVFQRSPLYSALSLIATFAAFAGHYIMLKAQFIAAIQIIVYAGAIIVLFVFVIMLLNVRSEGSRIDRNRAVYWIAAPFAVALLGLLFYVTRGVNVPGGFDSGRSVTVGTVEAVGHGLFTEYLLPFEATSVLIIMAIVGSMVLARRAQQTEEVDVSEDLDESVTTEEEVKAEV